MGTSTNAIMAFGFDLGEELPDEIKRQRDACEKMEVEIIEHCSDECPMYFLALHNTETTARRGYPVTVALRDIDQVEIDFLRSFCERNGIEWQTPDWHLFSMWS